MKTAPIAPLAESVPPRLYGGAESWSPILNGLRRYTTVSRPMYAYFRSRILPLLDGAIEFTGEPHERDKPRDPRHARRAQGHALTDCSVSHRGVWSKARSRRCR